MAPSPPSSAPRHYFATTIFSRPTSATLLLSGNDLEVTIVERVLLLLCALAALFGNLAPTATRLVLSRAGSVALIKNALVGELAAPNKLLGKMTAINIVRCGMDRFGDEFELGWEREEGRNEFLSCYALARLYRHKKTVTLTIYRLVEITTEFTNSPFLEFLLGISLSARRSTHGSASGSSRLLCDRRDHATAD